MKAESAHGPRPWPPAFGEGTLGTPDFTIAFTGAAALALLSLGFGWTLRHDAAAEVSGHRSKLAEV
jgi:hypothetical protein